MQVLTRTARVFWRSNWRSTLREVSTTCDQGGWSSSAAGIGRPAQAFVALNYTGFDAPLQGELATCEGWP